MKYEESKNIRKAHSQKLEFFTDIVSGLSHEILSPLNYILNFNLIGLELTNEIEFAFKQISQNVDETARVSIESKFEDLEMAFKQVQDHSAKINILINRINCHKVDLGEIQVCNALGLIRTALKGFCNVISKNKIEIKRHLCELNENESINCYRDS